MADKKKSKTIVRSTKTGQFVKQSEAQKHPATTVKERVKSTTHTGPGKTQKK